MSTALHPRLITVEEFERLAGDSGAELIDGVIVDRPLPTKKHRLIQLRLLDILRARMNPRWFVSNELEFRPKPEYNLPRADVAAVAIERWNEVRDDGYLPGSPDLQIEVISSSNSHDEIEYKRVLALRTGAQEFWVISPTTESVAVSTSNSFTQHFFRGERISLEVFGAGDLEVDEIFTHLDEL